MAFLSREILEGLGFKKLGQNVLISDRASIYRPSVIEIGDNVRIDDFCILSPGDDGISIGNSIHIGCQSTLIGRGKITLEDFSNISSKVSIYSSNDDYSGEWMTNPMVPEKFTNVTNAPVRIGKHTIIGASSVILPGVEIGDCCAVGSLSLVKESIEAGWIVSGTPAKKIKQRSLRIKDLEKEIVKLNKPDVSVAVSCYKFANYIEECIKSIQSQITNFNFEIVVADDYSQDGTIEILNRLSDNDQRIRILRSHENLGVYKNIKRLIENCNGKYIAFLDGDDYFTDEYKLQKQYDFLESNPNYVIHSTGYKMIDNNGKFIVSDDKHLIPLKKDVRIEDLLENNYITFGRMFKNLPNIVPDWAYDIEFLDWVINFEILKFGIARCEDWCSGVYRVSGQGMLTSKSKESIDENNLRIKNILNSKYVKPVKPVFIISTNVSDEISKKILEEHINSLDIKFPKMIISNSQIDKHIVDQVDYFLYSQKAKLFDEVLPAKEVDFWMQTDQFEYHDINPSYQKHSLAIMVNLNNALKLAKSMGYTHFFRIESDSLMGHLGNKFINTIPDLCSSDNKRGFLYKNTDDISTHFFYFEIEFFLNNIETIKSQNDFIRYLDKLNIDTFLNLEEFYYLNLKDKLNELIVHDGKNMILDFPDCKWNRIISNQNLPSKYRGSTTKISRIFERETQTDNLSIFSLNYQDRKVYRNIKIHFLDGIVITLNHQLESRGSWSYNNFGNDISHIMVYEGGEFLYEEKTQDIKNYIKMK